jgi:hypothetical protein
LFGDEKTSSTVRLFDSLKPNRLKWEDDEETFDEYRIRRDYIKKHRSTLKNRLVWDPSWGTFNKENALARSQEIK